MTTPQPQQGAKPAPEPVTVPVDTSHPLQPTHALSITHTKHHTILIHDLTPSLPSLFSPKTGLAIEEATKLIDATDPAPPTLFTLKKENLLCTHLTAHDREGKEVAEWKNPILSLHGGKVTIKFLGEGEEKVVEVNPIGHDRVSESFKLNNRTYIWEAESKYHQNKHLYEIIESSTSKPAPSPPATPETTTTTTPAAESDAIATTPTATVKKAREVARYTQKHVHGHGHAGGKEGLLVLDSERIGELEGVLTLCAMLEVRDLPEL